MPSYLEIFTDSFQRVTNTENSEVDFFAAFYDSFVADSAEAAEKFRNADMQKQQQHLRTSLDHMVYFSIDRQAGEELARIARTHSRSGRNIRPELYEHWLESLLKTVREFDPQYCDDVEIAWQVVLAPGIRYMQIQYERL